MCYDEVVEFSVSWLERGEEQVAFRFHGCELCSVSGYVAVRELNVLVEVSWCF